MSKMETTAKLHEQYIVGVSDDFNDIAVIAERRNESTISFDELKKRLKEDGLLPD
jgi:hypothetical protein